MKTYGVSIGSILYKIIEADSKQEARDKFAQLLGYKSEADFLELRNNSIKLKVVELQH